MGRWSKIAEKAGVGLPAGEGRTPRVPAVIQALESRHNDPDVGIRRRVRKTLAHYRRTGKVTDAAH